MKIRIALLLALLISVSTSAQISCSKLTSTVKYEGQKANSFCCFDSEFLTNVDFYTLSLDYQTYNFAIVTFNYYNTYIYCVPSNAKSNFLQYAFTDQAGEAFHAYIKPCKCDCY